MGHLSIVELQEANANHEQYFATFYMVCLFVVDFDINHELLVSLVINHYIEVIIYVF